MTRLPLVIASLSCTLAAQQLSFIACPVVRDTKTVPCWLAEYEGELYYLGVQQDINAPWSPPQQSHEVLVEGTVQPGPRVCGGIPLFPLSTSVMPELTRSCNTVLPAKDEIPAPAATRPHAIHPMEEPPSPPYSARDFIVFFDFDNDQMPAHSTGVIAQVAIWAATVHATSLQIPAARGSALLSDGRVLNESDAIATRRANKVARLLKGLGVPASSLRLLIEDMPAKPDGIRDPASRRVRITVRP